MKGVGARRRDMVGMRELNVDGMTWELSQRLTSYIEREELE